MPSWQDRSLREDGRVTEEQTGGEGAERLRSSLTFLRAGGRASPARLPDQWFIACASEELGKRPLSVTIQDVPLALFRDEKGVPAALLDRCPHRNVPLSGGRCRSDGTIECPYHGWRFDREGTCRAVPGLIGEPAAKARSVHAFATREQDGWIWVYSTPGVVPDKEPHRFARLDVPGYTSVKQTVEAEGSLYSTIENALDVPHTAFLHRGLFRGESRGVKIRVKVRRARDRVEAEYIGEPRPPGLVARILSPSGGVVTHVDRFILPSITQVEYRIGTENHFLADAAMTPVSEHRTRIHAVIRFKSRIPGQILAPIVRPLAMRVFQQDAEILRRQSETIRRFGGEQFASTDIDVLGRHIFRLLRAAERGDASPPEEETEVELVV